MELSLLRKKFRGCLLGVLLGDCLGSPLQGQRVLSAEGRIALQEDLDKLEEVERTDVIKYTDDSAMSLCIAQSLVEKAGLDVVDLAKKFVECFFDDQSRGYGGGVYTVFRKLRDNEFSDVLTPAKEQFQGEGSWGNGGSMRIAPVALYCYNDYEKLIEMTRAETHLTHTHKCGVNAAILQAMAIQQLLQLDPTETLDVLEFIDNLIVKMDEIEKREKRSSINFFQTISAKLFNNAESQNSGTQPYKTKLIIIKRMIEASLKDASKPSAEEVVKKLGNDIRALYSQPTALFCFLRAQHPIEGINTENPVRRAIQYSIALGGDTDTIGSMTGALAGAYYGDEIINTTFLKNCESSDVFANIADKLFDTVIKQ